eukprot:168804_1
MALIMNCLLLISYFLNAHAASDPIYGCRNLGSNMKVNIIVNAPSSSNGVDITFEGPDDAWYSYGLGKTGMDTANVIVINEDDKGSAFVEDRLLSGHTAGTVLGAKTQCTFTDLNSKRTAVCGRSVNDGSSFYTYPETPQVVDLIYATGTNKEIGATGASMASHGVTKIVFVDDAANLDCDATGSGAVQISQSIMVSLVLSIFCIVFNQ